MVSSACHVANWTPLRCLLLCWCSFAACGRGDKDVTIHIGHNPRWWKTVPNTWPCLEMVESDQNVHMNNYGCFNAFDLPNSRSVRWLVPETEGPIRPSARPDLCLDASGPISYLEGNHTSDPTRGSQSLLGRALTLRPCSGSVAQQFKPAGEHILLASMPRWALKIEVVALTLGVFYPGGPFVFTILEFRDPDTTSVFGGLAVEFMVTRILDAVVLLYVLVYLLVSVKELLTIRWRCVVLFFSGALSAMKKRTDIRIRTLAADRRLRRAQYVSYYASHLCALWTLSRINTFFAIFDFSEKIGISARLKLTDSELIPFVAMIVSFVLIRARIVKSSIGLDVLTVLFSVMWAFQYYMISQSMGGMNVEMYLYQESWMMLLRTCINLTIGRVAVAVPCSVAVTVVDVYSRQSLTALHSAFNWIDDFYPFKQAQMCLMVCTIHYCLERLSIREVEAELDRNQAQLYEQLATRLTTSMYDAVVHLDHRFHFAKPAPKLASILLRGQLGVFQTDFLQLVVPEDRARLIEYLESAAVANESDSAVPIMPIHIGLLDALGHPCRVQVFASAYRDDDNAAQYILGIGELLDVPNELRIERVCQGNQSGVSVSIPENSIIESDSDADASSNASSCTEGFMQFGPQTFELCICASVGNILVWDAAFVHFSRHDIGSVAFQSMFSDPAAVWAWLQVKLACLRSGESLSLSERLSEGFLLSHPEATFESCIEILRVESQDDGSSRLLLKLHVLRRHKRRRRSGKGAFSRKTLTRTNDTDMVFTLRAGGCDALDALEKVQQSAGCLFKALLVEGWTEWQEFWNECFHEFEAVPFEKKQGNFQFNVDLEHSEIYTVSSTLTIPATTASSRRLSHVLSRPCAVKLGL
eukprot:TRINITY_DN3875_c0_g2_i1.p1 TRINITY_DN3875_c0_g2~~TRINITY_DN3875_c0_g2_i1.p1  ORF type:complete len:871 (+),score=45.60 TRINITY_DN3875_c0_g2_i1:57-2669(+)